MEKFSIEKCKAEQEEFIATQQPGKLVNIDSLCRAKAEEVKCIDRDKYGS